MKLKTQVSFNDYTVIPLSEVDDFSDKGYISNIYHTKNNSTIVVLPRIVVYLKPSTTIDNILNNIKDLEVESKGGQQYILKCNVKTSSEVMNIIKILDNMSEVDWCEPEMFMNFKTHNTLYEQQYYLKNTGQNGGTSGIDINVEPAWNITNGKNIVVAVIDDGVDLNHEDLDRVLDGYTAGYPDEKGSPKNWNAYNRKAHGTACAGIIAATNNDIGIRGIASESSILPVNIIPIKATDDDQGFASTFDIADAMNWTWKRADVLSCSWDVGDMPQIISYAVDSAVNYGREGKGCLVVFSSGNNGGYISSYLANKTNVITVGAVDKKGNAWPYSCIGKSINLVAPSGNIGMKGDIVTLDIMSILGYGPFNYTSTFGGTSAACPQVAGVCALILSVNPNLTESQVKDILYTTARDLGATGFDYTYGYGLVDAYASVMKALTDYSCYNGETLLPQEITANKTLTTNYYGYGEIRVKSGKKLIVKSTLRMAPGSKIIVEPGAELRVENGEIIGACTDDYWEGIILEGTSSNKTQSLTYQGKVYLKNATIERGKTAISTLGADGDWGKTGGIIEAINTTFKNNHKSIQFLTFANDTMVDNKSKFSNCTFTWTNDLPQASTRGVAHMTLWQVRGISINGCTFKDERTNNNRPNETHGIIANESGYKIGCYRKSLNMDLNNPLYECVYNQFSNLTYGIRTEDTKEKECVIERSYFTNNYCGVYSVLGGNMKIKNNYFTVIPNNYNGVIIPNDTLVNALGIATNSSYNFEIEHNEFTGWGVNTYTVGLQIKNSGTYTNIVRENVFDKLYAGTQAIGNNHGKINATSLEKGLEYRCNEFKSSNFGIYVLGDDVSKGGIKSMQGSSTQPAYNTFTSILSRTISNNSANTISYYYTGIPLSNYSSKVTPVQTTSSGTLCGTIGVTSIGTPGSALDTTLPPIVPPIIIPHANLLSLQADEQEDTEEQYDNELLEGYIAEYGSLYNIPTEILQELAQHETTAGLKAKGMLYFKGIDMNYHPRVIIDEDEEIEQETPANKNAREEQNIANDLVSISPNPAKDYIDIQYIFAQDGEYTLSIINTKGIEVYNTTLSSKQGKETINLQSSPAGTYYYTIKHSNTIIKQGKFVLMK